MSEKQFNHIENRIREAAENSEPPFDEYAWSKMEAILDKEEGKKRRFFLWWVILPFLFIAAGGGTYFILNNKHAEKITDYQKNKNLTVDKSEQQKQKSESTDKTTLVNNRVNADKKADQDERIAPEISQDVKQSNNKNIDTENEIVNHNLKKIQRTNKGKLSSKIQGPELDATGETISAVDKDNTTLNQVPEKKDPENKITVNVNDTIAKVDSSKAIIVKAISDSNAINKLKETSLSKFYFLASLGAEVAGVKLFSFSGSQITPKYGIGVGYQISKKISVQTGFYAGTKKYVAGPGDYKSGYGSYWNSVVIIKVDASCLVYDIPLTIRYNFVQKPSTVYYATAGLSSFIMKQEDYYYYYMRNNVLHELAWTYTGNKNFFSVFNISIGIEKKLSPNFSIQAEPSISLPISGVGDGSVKLYSAALQVALKYNPYRKHK